MSVVYSLLGLQSPVLLILTLGLLGFKGWAFVDAMTRRADAFVAADKMTKQAWLIILGLALAAHFVLLSSPFALVNLVGSVAAIVYIVDARPAMQALNRR